MTSNIEIEKLYQTKINKAKTRSKPRRSIEKRKNKD